MRISFFIIVFIAHSIIFPNSPVEVPVHGFKAGRRQPTPSTNKVIEIPDHQMGEGGAQPKVRGEQINDPGSGIIGLRRAMVNDTPLSNQINDTPIRPH